jgi:hypothetical protein
MQLIAVNGSLTLGEEVTYTLDLWQFPYLVQFVNGDRESWHDTSSDA